MTKQEFRAVAARLGRSVGVRVLAVFVVLFIIYRCVAAGSERVTTEVVTVGQEDIVLSAEGVIAREETVLTVSGGPYLCSYSLPDGAKVGSSSTLGVLFTAAEDADTRIETQARLNALDERLRALDRLNTTDTLSHLSTLSAQARDTLLDTARDITDGAPMRDIASGAASLMQTGGRIDVLTGRIPSISSLRATVSAERQALLMAAGRAGRTLTVADIPTNADRVGGGWFYYGHHVDGYDGIFTAEALASMTVSSLRDLSELPPDSYSTGTTVVGKLVTDRYWSLALPVTTAAAEQMEVGDTYTVRFPDECGSGATLTMTLTRKAGSPLEAEQLLILRADTAPEGFRYTRFARVEIVLDTVRGYRLPTTALRRVSDDTAEVFVLEGGRVCLRRVQILTHGQGYVIAYAPTAEQRTDEQDETYHADNYVALRDIVITDDGGRDLYDGMYVD